MNIRDIELTTAAERQNPTCKTKRPWRLTDGVQHPVKVTKVSPEEMEELWQGDKKQSSQL